MENLYSDVIPPLRDFSVDSIEQNAKLSGLLLYKRLTPERPPTPKNAVYLTPTAVARLPDRMAAQCTVIIRGQ